MLSIFNNSSKEFKSILHHLLDITMDFFIDIGGNLNFEEIYAIVFPLHKQDDKEYIIKFLNNLHQEIVDDFTHEFTPMKEYVLYYILLIVDEGAEGDYLLDDEISKQLDKINKENLLADELNVLNSIVTPNDLIGICFEDSDFLDVHHFLELYKTNPQIVTEFFHIDLDYYIELMPEDIALEYNEMKGYLQIDKSILSLETKEVSFANLINDLTDKFNHFIVHKKGHTLINNKLGKYSEKEVQVLFDMFSGAYLNNYDVSVTREVDTGRGTVDFHISKGKKLRALIEFKLDSHHRFQYGLEYQLPTYLLTEEVKYGFYILICYSEDTYNKSEYLFKEAEDLSAKLQKTIRFKRINSSGNLKSASLITKQNEMGFTN